MTWTGHVERVFSCPEGTQVADGNGLLGETFSYLFWRAHMRCRVPSLNSPLNTLNQLALNSKRPHLCCVYCTRISSWKNSPQPHHRSCVSCTCARNTSKKWPGLQERATGSPRNLPPKGKQNLQASSDSVYWPNLHPQLYNIQQTVALPLKNRKSIELLNQLTVLTTPKKSYRT